MHLPKKAGNKNLLALAIMAALVHGTPTVASASTSNNEGTEQAENAESSRLLEIATEAANKIPRRPHIKTRVKVQESVVVAWLDHGMEAQAVELISGMSTWRRGMAQGELAEFLARQERKDEARDHLLHAEQSLVSAEEWQRARVLTRVSQVRALLGDEIPEAHREELSPADEVLLHESEETSLSEEEFSAHLAEIDELLASGTFDNIRAAQQACLIAYRQNNKVEGRGVLLSARIEQSLDGMPLPVRMETLLDLAHAAAEAGDKDAAGTLVQQALEIIESHNWLPEDEIKWLARVAVSFSKGGETEKASDVVVRAMALYSEKEEAIVNIWRAGALRAIASAFAEIGDMENARLACELALEAGMVNPNSVPRAEDLVATLIIVAEHDIDVDEAFLARAEEIASNLGDPW